MTQVEMNKEEAELEVLNYLEAEKEYKESKLIFGFTPELMLAIYINTFNWGKLNGSSLRFYYYHLMNIRDWFIEANNYSDEKKKSKFVGLAKENISKTNGKKLENFYYSLENYCRAKGESLSYDNIIDSLEKIINNIEFTSDLILGVEILVKDIQRYITKK
jgi:hypothetical protein